MRRGRETERQRKGGEKAFEEIGRCDGPTRARGVLTRRNVPPTLSIYPTVPPLPLPRTHTHTRQYVNGRGGGDGSGCVVRVHFYLIRLPSLCPSLSLSLVVPLNSICRLFFPLSLYSNYPAMPECVRGGS